MSTKANGEKVKLSKLDFIPSEYKAHMLEHFYTKDIDVLAKHTSIDIRFDNLNEAHEALLATMGHTALAETSKLVYLFQMDFIPTAYRQLMGEHIFAKFVKMSDIQIAALKDPNVPVYDSDDPHLPLEVGFGNVERAEDLLLETMGYDSSRSE